MNWQFHRDFWRDLSKITVAEKRKVLDFFDHLKEHELAYLKRAKKMK